MAFQRNTRRLIQFGLSLLITCALLYVLLHEEGIDDLSTILRQISLRGVAVYIILSLIGVILRAVRYQIILTDILGKEATPRPMLLILAVAVRNALADFLPARLGEVAYFYILKRFGVAIATTAAAFGFCFALDIIVLLLLIAVFFAVMPFLHVPQVAGILSHSIGLGWLVIGLILLVAVLVALTRILPKFILRFAQVARRAFAVISRRMPRLQRSTAVLDEAIVRVGKDLEIVETSGRLWSLVLLTVLLRLSKYGSLYVLLLAVVGQWNLSAADFHPGVTLIAFILAEASASLPISGIMGFGAYEASWVTVFRLAEVNLPYASKVAFIVHLLTQVKGYSIGLVAMLILVALEWRNPGFRAVGRGKIR